jgi:DNA-binding MarR family transcriptional regulator
MEIASAWLEDRKMSRSLLTGLLLLSALPAGGAFTTNSELARKLGISPSTCHRYLGTLLEVGLVERDPRKRHYRRVLIEAGDAGTAICAT